jgi:hypothetical protein
MQHTCYWNNEILTPIQKHGMQGAGADAFKKLKILLDRCMLRYVGWTASKVIHRSIETRTIGEPKLSERMI